MKKICFRIFQSRAVWLSLVLCASIRMFAVGWTPSDCGLVVNLQPNDLILLSVMVDDDDNPATPEKEYFVCHYNGYTGGTYNYATGDYLKLIPQDNGATKPSSASVWAIDSALTRTKKATGENLALGGIAYTMWHNVENKNYSLVMSNGVFAFRGSLTDNAKNENLADVIFVIPTNRSTSADPNGTLGKGTEPFDGATGVGFAGMVYREVYWFDIPRSNEPNAYTNASLVTFNTSLRNVQWNNLTVEPGKAFYAFADDKHKPTKRTLFRLYVINRPLKTSPDTYFFAYNAQGSVKYRSSSAVMTDSTELKRIYTIDYLNPMERVGESKYYQVSMPLPTVDSTYYYVGYKNKYRNEGDAIRLGSGDAVSQFTSIRDLPMKTSSGFSVDASLYAPAGAHGKLIVDTTSNDNNLGVYFLPSGVFLRTSNGRNIEMCKEEGDTSWICNEMWTIDESYAGLTIKATLMTGEKFSMSDPGVDIEGWSEYMSGADIPVYNQPGESVFGKSGWARIYTNNNSPNGGIEFVPAKAEQYIRYDNNGYAGAVMPDLHPAAGESKVRVEDARLSSGFTFHGWTTHADGSGVKYLPGTEVDLDTIAGGVLTLYAQASFEADMQIAVSFVRDGKRYFMTQPGAEAPRFSRARHFSDWTNVKQGMSDAYNTDPNYISTFSLVSTCKMCDPDERGLDAKRDTMYVGEDSLVYYENYAPKADDYMGLYYVLPWNVILANETWAGMFKSTGGWPDVRHPYIPQTKLHSEHYVKFVTPSFPDHPAPVDVYDRDTLPSYVKYVPETNEFDGVEEGEGTEFQLSAVVVADAHYVILPDTTVEWTNEIVFDYHEMALTDVPVWSKLIGKQLMAYMPIGNDTIYFHPNADKTLTTADALRLSPDYRVTESFSYIRDVRTEELHTIVKDDKPQMRETENSFQRIITSGMNSPMDVIYKGEYIDMCDTLRIRLQPSKASRVKDYYGRWKNGAEGLHIAADGSRYRDIIVRTKTYHYGAYETKLVLKPEFESYYLSPLKDQSLRLNFTLSKVTSRWLYDAQGNPVREDVATSEDLSSHLALGPGYCSFVKGNTYFGVINDQTLEQHVTLKTLQDNATPGINEDTLVISMNITIDAESYRVTSRVPLTQPTLEDNELVWSVEKNGQRYFITAGSGGLIFRQYTQRDKTLYKKDSWTKLQRGAKDAANSDASYITTWVFDYAGEQGQSNQQLTMHVAAPVNRYFYINGSTPTVDATQSSILTYEYVDVHVNSNANFEEMVRIKYGADQWLKFNVTAGVPSLSLVTIKDSASVFSWTYLMLEYNLMNDGNYPSQSSAEFGYNSAESAAIQTRYKAYREYSLLLNNSIANCCKEECSDISKLIASDKDWKTSYAVTLVGDSRFPANASGLNIETNGSTLITTITPSGDSPIDDRKPYEDIVDTLDVRISLQSGAPTYRFKEAWSDFESVEDAHLKLPLVRKTYHHAPYDSLVCVVADDEYNFTFPSTINGDNDKHTFTLGTERRFGTNILDVDNHAVHSESDSVIILTKQMDFTDPAYAEIRLIDELGNSPSWCQIIGKTANTVTMQCTENGIRAPRTAYLYFAYVVEVEGQYKYVNFRLSVSQNSYFQYANNQTLIHTKGASGDPMVNGVQQVHEHKRVLYYYPDQNVELPVRERGFYGWWRWHRMDKGVEDTDIPAEEWRTAPRNVGKYNYPYRIIGDSVWVDEKDHSRGKQLVTMGRYTVFHYPSRDYASRNDPPAKSPLVAPPTGKATVNYAVDISNYFDNLPLSMSHINQVDTAMLDTMRNIQEPTLSIREIFELRPWTEMAAKMEGYKDTIASSYRNQRYMEDHVVMAPIKSRLLLSTEQRYNYKNLSVGGHSESLLGYYMRDDNWNTWEGDEERQDSMIWVAGWDVKTYGWYIYNPKSKTYSECKHGITEGDDFLNVPAKASLPAGKEADTIYYCFRARSMKTTGSGDNDVTVDGDYWFNICRYMVIYHDPLKYGPLQETTTKGVAKAIITNDEIEQNYEVLERLNFDYNRPGKEYRVYPHPLPWSDASYGYSYPESDEVPNNRYHNDFAANFPNMGEYGIINRIPYSDYWHMMEQHGGAENGYMIYCDGMSSAGQVAAISLQTHLCEGQKMYFSGYVGNPSNAGNKSNPNFLFSVQGSLNGTDWKDITSYMTGDIPASNKWYQIFFPIHQEGDYQYYRVRIFNMSSSNDGNDFIIDDMCIFATKPPLIAYQANTTCMEAGENDSVTHVVLRVDYQGFSDDSYNGKDIYYTVQKVTKSKDTTFVALMDGYINEATKTHIAPSTTDTIYGTVRMPQHTYNPQHDDSVFTNLTDLVTKFENSYTAHQTDREHLIFRQGYIYENIDGVVRPVMYIIHKAKMTPENSYIVRMSAEFKELMSSICAMTSRLKVSNRMTLVLNDEEQDSKEIVGMCANTTYDISLRVRGSLILDSVAPIDINGSCANDWLLYGDTAEVSSELRYGYKYSDILTVVKEILRYEPMSGTNANQFARNLTEVSRNEMIRIMNDRQITNLPADPYTILSHLVNNGFLTMYRPKLTVTATSGDSIMYTILPIVGTGSDAMLHMAVEVCPTPIHVKLKPAVGGDVPMVVGGFHRQTTQKSEPSVVLVDGRAANTEIMIPIDSIMSTVALNTITLLSTNDPEYSSSIHSLSLQPDREYDLSGGDNSGYYTNGDTLVMHPASSNTYQMLPGYNYTFGIEMMTRGGSATLPGSDCRVGIVPFTVSVVPDNLRWDPKTADNNQWNNPANWIGINQQNIPIHADAHFAPLPSTSVVIAPLAEGLPYPEMLDLSRITPQDSVKQTGFEYNTCADIRFMAGTALGQQQYLNYANAIVDLSTPQNKWAFRSAPLTGMLTGDVFMADADLTWHTSPWEVGAFDAHGRNVKTGSNASFWISLYNRETIHKGNNTDTSDSTRTANDEWSKATNVMSYPLPPAQGWAVFTRTASGRDASVKLPKNDDIYYYYTASGEKVYELYENGLRAKRDASAGGSGKAGKLAYQPQNGTAQYTLTNAVASTSFVFGNPTMGYIDIWGFIADNELVENFDYMSAEGRYTSVSKKTASETENVISTRERYLPPMHAIVLTAVSGTKLNLRLNTNRVITQVSQVLSPIVPASAPRRAGKAGLRKGIMTITAVNPVSDRCVSRLQIGQGYHDAIVEGEDAVLTTINIDNYTSTSAPATPFNIYASEAGYGLSIDLRDEVVNVPLSFYMSDLPYEPVTQLWFTGVNTIDGQLVLYDAWMDSEQPILDGICLTIETPVLSHQTRYYIRRSGYTPGEQPTNPVATGIGSNDSETPVIKIIRDGNVLILRDGHLYTMFGQKIR